MDEGARVWVADPADGRVWRPARIHAVHAAPPAVTVEFEDEEAAAQASGAKESEGANEDANEDASEDASEETPPERAVVPLAFKASGAGKAAGRAADDKGECVNVLPRNAEGRQAPADLVALPHLHEASILHALRLRYARHAIYTLMGEILISVNPFEKLPALYTRARMRAYAPDDPAADDPEGLSAGDPHLFAVARAAYVDVARNARNQSILISGESGAGKTEATKIVMKYFALTCGQSASALASASASAPASTSIETQVLQSNPILESFGNARTVRNDNSSRFGKFIELEFDPRGPLTLRGARIRTYLLEKIRVIQQARHERNFHVFYELLARPLDADAGADADATADADEAQVSSLLSSLGAKRRAWGLRDAARFRLLNQSGCMARRDGVEDGAQFRRTLRAMEQLGLSGAEISSVLEIVAAVLHMGNVEFAETVVRRKNSRNRSVSESDRDADIVHATTTVKVVRVRDVAREVEDEDEDADEQDDVDEEDEDAPMDHFGKAAALLGVAPEQLERALTRRWLRTANETLEVALDVGHAENTRNALAMECYRLLFEWLVGRINDKIRPDAGRLPSRGLSRESSATKRELSIGLLDIFGFEDMAVNSFEQLCINYANEALQHQFNEFVFASEQRLYREEGILALDGASADDPHAMALDGMQFPDNSACLELFEKKPLGLFSLTDQECVFPQGNDRALVAKLYSAFASGDAATAGGSAPQQPSLARSRSSSAAAGTHASFVMASALQRSTHFGVAHYAGRVLYTAEGFLAKNKDAFCESAVLLLAQSSNPLIQSLAISATASAAAKSASAAAAAGGSVAARRPAVRRANSSIAAMSVGTQFKLQLNELLDIIRGTTPHYVRCIKPNDASSCGAFDTRRVVEQLRSGGVLEAVRVARAGFPVRLSHEQFLERYLRVLLGGRTVGARHDPLVVRDDVRACLDQLTVILEEKQQHQQQLQQSATASDSASLVAGVRLGCTRVFFRRKPFEALEKLRGAVRASAATVIQTRGRGFSARRRYWALLRAVLVLQCLYRGHCARLATHAVRANVRATAIQRVARGFCARHRFAALRSSALLCQSLVRMRRARRVVQALREHRAATRAAACWKRWAAQRAFRRLQSAVLSLQCLLRARMARRELMELKRESRNVAKLQEDNSALKTELAALRAQLAAMQLRQQQQALGPCGLLPTPVHRPMGSVTVASVLVPEVSAPMADKEQLRGKKTRRGGGGGAVGMEPQEDRDASQQELRLEGEEEEEEEEEEGETSMSIPSFAYQTPGSDSCEESNNNQLQNDAALASSARPVVGGVSASMLEDAAPWSEATAAKALALEAEPLVRPEDTPLKAASRTSAARPRRFSLPDIPSAFSLTSTPCNTAARAAAAPTPGADDACEADGGDAEALVMSPRSRDRRHSLDLWLARQELVEEELQQLREEVRATALAVASAETSSAPTPTAQDQKEVMEKYVATQIKAATMRLQLQPPPASPSLRLDMDLVDNNCTVDEENGGDDDDNVTSTATWRAPASVSYTLSHAAIATPHRRLDAVRRVAGPLSVRSRSDATPHPPASSSSCYAQRARNARTAWSFAGAASVAKPRSTRHTRGLQAYFADDDASDDELEELGGGARGRELPRPTRSASLGLPPLRGGLGQCGAEDEDRSPVISTAWTPVRPPRKPVQLVPRWTKDAQCTECKCAFGLLVRRHHCRQCGHSFCYEHSTRKLRLPHFGYAEPQRVCDACFEAHLLGLSTRPSGSPDEASGWRRKRREASMAMARAAAEAMAEDDALRKMAGTPRLTRRDTETSSVDSVAVAAGAM